MDNSVDLLFFYPRKHRLYYTFVKLYKNNPIFNYPIYQKLTTLIGNLKSFFKGVISHWFFLCVTRSDREPQRLKSVAVHNFSLVSIGKTPLLGYFRFADSTGSQKKAQIRPYLGCRELPTKPVDNSVETLFFCPPRQRIYWTFVRLYKNKSNQYLSLITMT